MRLFLALFTLLALMGLTACAAEEERKANTPSRQVPAEPDEDIERPETDPEPQPDTSPYSLNRFTGTAENLSQLAKKVSKQYDEEPRGTEEANKLAGLDEETPLYFVDYVGNGDESQFCLVDRTHGTYAAMVGESEAITLLIGVGECSYDEGSASVVGSIYDNTWVKGGELMEDVLPSTILQ